MDLLEVKSRVAEALVESIFRRARYSVEPYPRDEAPPLRVGREDFSPDFGIRLNGRTERSLVEVKYRSSVDQYMSVENQRGDRSVFATARRQWPELCFVFVTDRPLPGRSCFQALSFPEHAPGAAYDTVDLGEIERFRIFPHNIADHENLLRRIFSLLVGV
ncbi:MAG: hypothetical protein FJ027_08965 [Candidatus Rokubacteria bacterium]|nr:hypothetical protein [Candidatus Rokubacteria bacterium]